MGKFVYWLKSKSGQAMTEYGLVIALVAIVVLASLFLLRDEIVRIFTSIINALKQVS